MGVTSAKIHRNKERTAINTILFFKKRKKSEIILANVLSRIELVIGLSESANSHDFNTDLSFVHYEINKFSLAVRKCGLKIFNRVKTISRYIETQKSYKNEPESKSQYLFNAVPFKILARKMNERNRNNNNLKYHSRRNMVESLLEVAFSDPTKAQRTFSRSSTRNYVLRSDFMMIIFDDPQGKLEQKTNLYPRASINNKPQFRMF